MYIYICMYVCMYKIKLAHEPTESNYIQLKFNSFI